MIEDVVSRLEAVYSKAHGDGWAYAVPEDLRALLDAYREATKPWAGDKPLAADDEIRLAHPTVSKNHDRYELAMEYVGAKHSKYALVDLVNWLLSERDAARAEVDALKKVIASVGSEEHRAKKEGYALADSVRLCHSDERDCYHRWTVYGERPSIPTTSRLAEIRKRLAEAPAGPWRMGENEDAQVFIQAIRLLGEMAGAELLICEVETDWPKPAREIGDLIANAPADLAWACDRIELLEGLLREAREYLKWRFCGDDALDARIVKALDGDK